MYSWKIIHGKHKRIALQSLINLMDYLKLLGICQINSNVKLPPVCTRQFSFSNIFIAQNYHYKICNANGDFALFHGTLCENYVETH